ncbi:unnamed protein product [Durusdinium trenchii]|uniref:Uncharacterized protein n=1 Tax=Durusdinium trenchii TaxID=1381693 RepID=A0ABP0LQF4_9DINO
MVNSRLSALTPSTHTRVLVLKFKADSFVNSSTSIAEVGGIKVVDANGTCLSCDSYTVCSSPNPPDEKGASGNVTGREWASGKSWRWKVLSSSVFDFMLQTPISKLKGDASFGVVINSAVDSSGENSEEQQGRQVTNWVVTSVLGTQDTSTGKWLRSAWSKVAVNLNGDFRYGVSGSQGAILTKDPEAGKD